MTFDPPVEDLTTSPPTLGAPLNLTIIFAFDGVPAGPFDEVTLPIFTTPADATEAAAIPPGVNQVLAKGSYAVVGNTVEFRPFIPTQPLEVDVGAPAAAVPGLLPASTYTVRVTPAPGPSISNLVGQGGEVRIETTSSTAAYYPKSAGSGSAPAVVVTDPGDGAAIGYIEGALASGFAAGNRV